MGWIVYAVIFVSFSAANMCSSMATQNTAMATQSASLFNILESRPPTPVNSALKVPRGFEAVVIANVPGARGLAALPNGDLLVGTGITEIKIVSNADGANAVGPTTTFATFPNPAASSSPCPTNSGPQSVAFGGDYLYVGTEKLYGEYPTGVVRSEVCR